MIRNTYLSVAVTEHGSISIMYRPTKTALTSEARLPGRVERISPAKPIRDTFGAGRALDIKTADGATHRIALYTGVPFVFFRTTLRNRGKKPLVLQKVPSLEAPLNLTVTGTELKALGTAGLTGPHEHEGSYVFLAVADPKTRTGAVSGWVTHDRGSGVVFSSVSNNVATLRSQIDYGDLRIKPGASAATETFVLGYFDDARIGLEQFADLIAGYYDIRLPPVPSGYCTWYSKPYGMANDEEHLAEFAEDAARKLRPYGFDFIQIDDCWQDGKLRNGPAKLFFQHNPKGPYPNGVKGSAEHIRGLGMTPGLWFMPFAGDHRDSFFKEYPDWFVKKKDGSPFHTNWGGTSLDMTNPEARAYLRDIVKRIAGDWGYTYFKMDGLYTGAAVEQVYRNAGYQWDKIGEAVFYNPNKTNIEAYRDGLKLVRKTAGKDVYLLGCSVTQNMRTFGGSFGLVDAMRIGLDSRPKGKQLERGPFAGANRYFLHGRVWHNDPDPLYVRASMPIEQARLISSWIAISGQLTAMSDWLPGMPEERLDIIRRCMPNHRLKPRPVDLFKTNMPRMWLLTDTRGSVRRDVLALYNWDGENATRISCDPADTGLPEADSYVGFDFWRNRFLPRFSGTKTFDVPAGSCRILAIRPAVAHPQVISTSRHVSQGIVELRSERWDNRAKTLSGTSAVVANDPYELRIVVPAKPRWNLKGVTVNDAKATVAFKQTATGNRITITSSTSRKITWRATF